jgi:hypothetical protein
VVATFWIVALQINDLRCRPPLNHEISAKSFPREGAARRKQKKSVFRESFSTKAVGKIVLFSEQNLMFDCL